MKTNTQIANYKKALAEYKYYLTHKELKEN
jgi:hypothetical protein